MAISLIATGSGSAINGGDVTVTYSAAGAAGDVAYVAITTRATVAASILTSGYNEIATSLTGGAGASRLTIYRKIFTGEQTLVAVQGNGDAGSVTAVSAFIVRGVDNFVPEDIISAVATGSSTNPDPPSVTTATRGTRAIVFAGSQVNDAPGGAPTGYGNLTGANNTDTIPASCYGVFRSSDITTHNTAENPATFTTWNTGAWASFTIILRQSVTDLYWVGGTGTWSSTNAGNWALTSGSATVGYIPSGGTNVIFNSASDSSAIFTVSLSGASCKNLTASGLDNTMTLSGSGSNLQLYGNLSVPATNFTQSYTGTTTFSGTGSQTITTNGKSFTTFTFDGVGGTWTLQDALTLTGVATLTNGTLALGSYTFTCLTFTSANTNTRTINFGTGKIVITSVSSGLAWNTSTPTNLTISGTSLVELTGGGATDKLISTGTPTEANAISFTISNTTGGAILQGSANNITIANNVVSFYVATNATAYGNFTVLGSNPTVTVNNLGAALIFAATSGSKTITTNGATLNIGLTFNGVGGTWTLQDALTINDTATLTNGTLSLGSYTFSCPTFTSSNANARTINFGTGKIVVTSAATATVWTTTTITNLTISGTSLVQLTGAGATTKTISAGALSEANSISFQISNTAGTVTFTASNTVKNLTIDNNSISVSNIAITIYGNLSIGGTNPSMLGGTNTWTFAATSSKTITTSGEILDFPITFNGVGGTWALQDALAVGIATSRTVTLTNGILELNSYTFTIFGIFSSTNSNTRRIQMSGSGGKIVLSLNTATTVWNTATVTNLTTDSNILVQLTGGGAVTKTISAGTLSEANAISFQVSCTSGTVTFTASNTVKNLTLDSTGFAFSNVAITIYGNFNIGGSGAALSSGANAWTFAATSGTKTITTNAQTLTFPIIFNSGLGELVTNTVYTVSSSYIDNNPPTYQYMNDSNANGSTNNNQWGSNSESNPFIKADLGSTQTLNRIVIGYDYLNNLPGSWGVTYTEGLSVQTSTDNTNWTTQATTPTYASSGSTNGLVTISLSGISARYVRLTKASGYMATLEFQVWVGSAVGTWQLQDALTMNSSRVITLTSGTFDLNSYTCTAAGGFTVTGTDSKVLAHGTADLVISLAGATAFNATGSNLTSTGTGKIDMTSASAKTFVGNGNSYATLNQGGAGTLTVTGSNTFQNMTDSVQPATILFTAGTTNTFTNDFDLNGTSGNLITLGSVTPTSTFTLSKSSGTVDVSFCSISDSIATGGASWKASTTTGNVDGGNNTGWSFAAIVAAFNGAFLLLF